MNGLPWHRGSMSWVRLNLGSDSRRTSILPFSNGVGWDLLVGHHQRLNDRTHHRSWCVQWLGQCGGLKKSDLKNQFVNVNKEKRGTCPSSMGKHLWFASPVERVCSEEIQSKIIFAGLQGAIDIWWPWVYLMTQLSYLFINSCAETDCRGGTKGLFDCTRSSAQVISI